MKAAKKKPFLFKLGDTVTIREPTKLNLKHPRIIDTLRRVVLDTPEKVFHANIELANERIGLR